MTKDTKKDAGTNAYVFSIKKWNDDLSPWVAPAVFGNENFGGKAHKTLKYIENDLLLYLKEKYGSDNDVD